MPINVPIEPTSQESYTRIVRFLQAHGLGVLSTVDDGIPHGAVIYFYTDDDFTITFNTKVGTKKYKDLQKNPNISLTAYEIATQTTVQLEGSVEQINDEQAKHDAFVHMVDNAMQSSHAIIPPLTKLLAGKYVAFTIKLRQAKMATFLRPDPGSYEMYEVIDFTP